MAELVRLRGVEMDIRFPQKFTNAAEAISERDGVIRYHSGSEGRQEYRCDEYGELALGQLLGAGGVRYGLRHDTKTG